MFQLLVWLVVLVGMDQPEIDTDRGVQASHLCTLRQLHRRPYSSSLCRRNIGQLCLH